MTSGTVPANCTVKLLALRCRDTCAAFRRYVESRPSLSQKRFDGTHYISLRVRTRTCMPNEETTAFPEWVVPMAATLTQERFTRPEWIFERKLDGIRLLAFKDGPNIRLLSRNRLRQNGSYPSVVEAIAKLPVHDVILDGEATGVWGKRGKVVYHVFDILWLDGRDVTLL